MINVDRLKKFRAGENAVPLEVRVVGPPVVTEQGVGLFEVEAVIGSRRSAGGIQYLVHWKDYLARDATWQNADDLEEASESVKLFERKRAEAVRVAHLAVLLIDVSAVSRSRLPDTPESRAAAIREATTVHAADPNRPAANAHGARLTPAQRCTAYAKKGGRCANHTKRGQHCWTHMRSHAGLRIAQSDIPGACLGLFAAREFKMGEIVARYTGDIHMPDDDSPSVIHNYLLQMNSRTSIDAARTNTAEGRWVNDPRGSGTRSYVAFKVDTQRVGAVLRAKRIIRVREEILASYGGQYWAHGTQKRLLRPVGQEAPLPAVARPRAPAAV